MISKNGPIRVLSGFQNGSEVGSDLEVIGLEFDILDEPIRLCVGVSDGSARLSDIVPLARALSTEVALLVLGKLVGQQEYVPCCKGCSACCNYLIPVSVGEAFRMREELLQMPPKKGAGLLNSFLDSSMIILESMNEGCDLGSIPDAAREEQLADLGGWYANLNLPCPFLSDGICTSYEQRPTVCREHIVTESALLCDGQTFDKPNVAAMPVSIGEALVKLASQLEQSEGQAVMLPLFLPWTEENIERGERSWPAKMMLTRFVEIIKRMAMERAEKTEDVLSEVG